MKLAVAWETFQPPEFGGGTTWVVHEKSCRAREAEVKLLRTALKAIVAEKPDRISGRHREAQRIAREALAAPSSSLRPTMEDR